MQPLRVQARRLAPEPSAPDIATLAKRFVEPLRGEEPPAARRLTFPRPTLVPTAIGIPATAEPSAPAVAQDEPRRGRNALISAVVVLALIALAMLLVRLWQDNVASRAADEVAPAAGSSAARSPSTASLTQPEQHPSKLEVALSSPDRIEANARDVIAFPIAIDATEALPARSIVAVTALPEGASFSEGRPYGVTGWSLRPDEIGDLQLRLPARGGASDMRLELVAGDGTVLAQSETRLSIAPLPADTAAVAENASNPFEQVAAAEATGSIESVPPAPQQKPAVSAGAAPSVKVNTVKVVPIPAPESASAQPPAPAPHPARTHDGGYGLGPATDEPQAPAEWMVTKAPVDMHAKAGQSSETVKVADKGLKLKVVARDKNWVQVTDPKTSTTGWIYKRFLTPAEPAAPVAQ